MAGPDPARLFTSGRSSGLHLGEAEVSFPASHRRGRIEEPKWYRFELKEDPAKHVVIRAVRLLNADTFWKRIGTRVDASPDKDLFVFVHGYNVTFSDAVKRTAQVAWDLEFWGAPLLYSWPSFGDLENYMGDESNNEWARTRFVRFLESVLSRSGAARVHVLAHSMGSRLVLEVVKTLAARTPAPRLGQIILAAPDVDAQMLDELQDAFKIVATNTTVYGSRKDKAILASKALHNNPRAGDPSPGTPIPAWLDYLDASDVDTDFLGHGYVATSTVILDDVAAVLSGLLPAARKHVSRDEARAIWLIR